jgi:hypothetical protein
MEPKVRTFDKTSCERLQSFMETHDLTQSEMGVKLGYSTGAVAGWLHAGECPKVVDNLLKAWDKASQAKTASTFIITVAGDKVETFRNVCKLASIELKAIA